MEINIEEIVGANVRRQQVNSADLREITIYYQGKRVDVPEELYREHEFRGLNNMYFFDFVVEYLNESKNNDRQNNIIE